MSIEAQTATRPEEPAVAPASGPRPRALRVLVLTNMWPTEGYSTYGVFVESQVRAIAELGVDIRVHFINGWLRRRAFVRSAVRIARLNFGEPCFDLIHAHTGHAGTIALLQRRIPVLVSYVGYDILGEPEFEWRISLKSRIESALFRRLSPRFERTITKSAEMEAALPPAVQRTNTVLPNGVNRELFRSLPRGIARQRLGWDPETPVILFVGDPKWGRKRFDVAEAAVERARRRHPNLELRVLVYRTQAEVVLWMNAADILVVTSNVEGSPNAVKEAMACNLPIVSTDVGDVRDIVAGTRHCHIVPQDPEAIAAAISTVLEAGPARSNGRQRSEWLDSEVIARRLLALYEETANSTVKIAPGCAGDGSRRVNRH